MEDARRLAPAAERNKEPILSVLRGVLPQIGAVLEIGSGTGQHVAYFATHFPGVVFQPSDPDVGNHASIAAWVADAGVDNVRPPVALDVTDDPWPVSDAVDAVFSANMIHIAPWEAAVGLFRGAAPLLRPGGTLLTYGPYKVDGQHTAPSNAAFDEDLRARDPRWGVRDVADLDRLARDHGLEPDLRYPMPANNQLLVFRRP